MHGAGAGEVNVFEFVVVSFSVVDHCHRTYRLCRSDSNRCLSLVKIRISEDHVRLPQVQAGAAFQCVFVGPIEPR